MAKRYHIEKLNTMLQHLADVLHVSILILDEDENTLSKIYDPSDYCSALHTIEGVRSKCHLCDKQIVERCKSTNKTQRHICHAGLCDLAMPIQQSGHIVAYVVLGRMRTSQSPAAPRYHDVPKTVQALYKDVPFFTETQLSHLCDLLQQIVLDCAIVVEYDTFTDDVIPYIRSHLHEPLSVPLLCKRYHLSKNTLYRFFKEQYGCSIGAYISSERMKLAKNLLCSTDCTVYDISEQIGMNNYTYFCKWFKQQNGITPTAYRHTHKKTDESV